MASVKWNIPTVVDKMANTNKAVRRMEIAVREKFNVEKQILLDEFNDHPVTRELNAGPNADSQTDALKGTEDNLYAFLGLNAGRNPVQELFNLLTNRIGVRRLTKITKASRLSRKFIFQVDVPTQAELDDATPMDWPVGKSWLRSIERGVRGLSYFISKRFAARSRKFQKVDFSASRSGGGIQLNKPIVKGASFKGIPYLSELFNNFRNRLGNRLR